ncbi:17-beta-hydroxysteroid dehydrogenase-like protein [Kluyveromyces lactis]|uniref:KLLA0F18788p n=1 Tax=Kluyveromyces lactis (strain ATCC 8585 / CBS 2359 / DSM 70799 / NBRC 1267 / NRRL Y-1140 / WM37) TaxID=284590 RepID=Q6CJG7_KLULA|nr:uncharacterized protein KLLA0_F18788g [Kluyveromyces lactis]CAG98630.1 KLLA0F18788p [Kluyveromyces lactis]|eukprot:XP_455922.1 uncharacterized protein KLLA0_F18788g [Kluyveromyces lactis]
MFDKLKQKVLNKSREVTFLDLPQPGELKDERIFYQNRTNYGVNFGSMFVLEQYIFHSLFSAGGGNEFDAITNQVKASNSNDTAKKLSDHYDSYLNRVDWNWLRSVGCTAIRLPVGYWHVKNGELLKNGEKFYSLKDVYSKSKPWDRVKKVISLANENKIGVLLDLHGLPGGANGDAHSGEQSCGSATFFDESSFVKSIVDNVIPFVVQDLQSNVNLIGLQIVNEAQFDESGKKQKSYYEKAVEKVRSINSTLPVVISDGWWPQQWSDWVQEKKLFTDVIIDSHVYRCFSDSDKAKNVEKLIQDLSSSVQFDRSKADFTVAEFSCVIDGQSWDKTSGNRDDLVKKYGQAQTSIFQRQASWGWFFWTLQFESGDGGEWGYIPMVNKGAIPNRPTTWKKPDNGAINKLVEDHKNYWADKGGDKMEHWRFEDALRNTIKDIESFTTFNNSLLGRTCAWKYFRRVQYIKSKGDGEYMWEWEQGFDQAIANFNHY